MAGFRRAFALFGLGLAIAACGGEPQPGSDEGPPPDGELASIPPAGKADSPFSACEIDGALLWVNDPAIGLNELRAAGVHTTSAKNIVAEKSGADGVLGSADDVAFRSLAELDAVHWVGPVALGKLAKLARAHCPTGAYPSSEVVFSPQPWPQSHLARAVQSIDAAERSIDIAMYSFRDKAILDALDRARKRGVAVRFLFEPARAEAKSPAGTTSAEIEARGIDVRFVNKIMHHKLMIVDGPQTSPLEALTTTVLTGSANWSSSAATRYDENTIALSGVPELALEFQREFDVLWKTSRDFVLGSAFERVDTRPIEGWMLLDDPNVDVRFTSANFEVFTSALGPGFSTVAGKNAVADRLVELIQGAESSIWIASGHLRSRPVAEALLARRAESPELDIRIYLDGQEYISAGTHAIQQDELASCLAAAGDSESKTQSCLDKGFYYSYPMELAGIDLRFKHYAYRWHYTYAEQMHHKYLLIDQQVLASGSYNLSDNAEHQTMENMVVYRGGAYQPLVAAFVENFDAMWATGVAEGRYQALLDEIQNGTGPVPIVYPSMALDWQQVTTLKQAIRDACSDVDSLDFRVHPEKHFTCSR